MKIIVCVAIACVLPMGAQAQLARNFPPQAIYCQAISQGLPQTPVAEIDGKGSVRLSAAMVIRDESNRIIVNGALPASWRGMCIFSSSGDLEKLWILTPEQADRASAQATEKTQ